MTEVREAVGEIALSVVAERANQTRQIHEHRPWLHWDKRLAAYAAARKRDRVLVCPNVSKHLPMAFVDAQFLFSKTVKFFPEAGHWEFGVLQSVAFLDWAFSTSRRRGAGIEFSSRASIDTFPPPVRTDDVASNGETLSVIRSAVMQDRGISLTELLNLQDEPSCIDEDIERVRNAQVELDAAMFSAYGWDISPEREFRETDVGMQFCLPLAETQRVVMNLLGLNSDRYAEEAAAGLHDRKLKKTPERRVRVVDQNQDSLL